MYDLKLVPNVAVSENGFLFLPTTGESFTLNQVGTFILNEIKSNKTLEEIKKSILDNFQTDYETVDRDLTDFITQLRNFKLVERS